MAILKLSGFLTQISGKYNGSIFCKTNNGQVVKNNSYSLPQRSTKQLQQQSNIQFVSSRWLLLNTTQKNNWLAAANDYPTTNKVGETVFYSAYSLFLMLNNNLREINEPINLNVPTFLTVTNADWSLFLFSSVTITIRCTNAVANTSLIVYGYLAKSVNQQPKPTQFLKIGVYPLIALDNFLIITTDLQNIFGAVFPGNVMFLKFKTVSSVTGAKSEIGGEFSALAF